MRRPQPLRAGLVRAAIGFRKPDESDAAEIFTKRSRSGAQPLVRQFSMPVLEPDLEPIDPVRPWICERRLADHQLGQQPAGHRAHGEAEVMMAKVGP